MILRDTITLVLKITHACNLNCHYCFYTKKDYLCTNENILKIDTLKYILEETAKICNNINLIFHGGEPLLMPIEYFEEILNFQKILQKKESVSFKNSLQSNGTIFNNEVLELIKNMEIDYGVSLDGQKDVHNSNRVLKENGKGSFDLIIENLDKLKQNNINISSLVVATKNTIENPLEFYNFFKSNGINIKINELFFEKEDEHLAPTNKELASFMIQLFDLWFNDKSKESINIEPFTTIISSFWGENSGDCSYKSSCTSFFLVETDGSITLCSRLKFLNHNLGNLYDNTWKEILKNSVLKKLNNRILEPNEECANCYWFKACFGGCTASAYTSNGNMYLKTNWCESRMLIFEHIYNQLQTLN